MDRSMGIGTGAERRSVRRRTLPPLPESARNGGKVAVSVTGPPLLAAALQALLAPLPEFLVSRGETSRPASMPTTSAAHVHLAVLGNAPGWCEALRRMAEQQRQEGGAICLVLNAAEDPVRVREIASCQGIRAFVTLEDEVTDLRKALFAAAQGEAYCSPGITAGHRRAPGSDERRVSTNNSVSRPISDLAEKNLHPEEGGRNKTAGVCSTQRRSLSERQWEVAGLAAHGLSNQEIGERLFIDVTTVKSHLTEVFLRLGIRRRSQIQARIGSANAFREEVSVLTAP